MSKRSKLAKGQIEIVWANGQLETIQTSGMAYNAGAIVLSVGDDKVVIPFSSIKRFRVPAVS